MSVVTELAEQWEKRGWRCRDGSTPENLYLAKKTYRMWKEVRQTLDCYITISAISRDYNKIADELAKKGADEDQNNHRDNHRDPYENDYLNNSFNGMVVPVFPKEMMKNDKNY